MAANQMTALEMFRQLARSAGFSGTIDLDSFGLDTYVLNGTVTKAPLRAITHTFKAHRILIEAVEDQKVDWIWPKKSTIAGADRFGTKFPAYQIGDFVRVKGGAAEYIIIGVDSASVMMRQNVPNSNAFTSKLDTIERIATRGKDSAVGVESPPVPDFDESKMACTSAEEALLSIARRRYAQAIRTCWQCAQNNPFGQPEIFIACKPEIVPYMAELAHADRTCFSKPAPDQHPESHLGDFTISYGGIGVIYVVGNDTVLDWECVVLCDGSPQQHLIDEQFIEDMTNALLAPREKAKVQIPLEDVQHQGRPRPDSMATDDQRTGQHPVLDVVS